MEPSSQPTAHTKADLGKRFIAAVIDGAIAGVVGLIPWLGGIIGGLYILLRDGLDYEYLRGRSVGKTIMKLKPVRLDGQPMDITTSIKRNWMLALGLISLVLVLIPVIGWIALALLWVAAPVIGLIEVILVATDKEGRRWGDRLSGTKVVETTD